MGVGSRGDRKGRGFSSLCLVRRDMPTVLAAIFSAVSSWNRLFSGFEDDSSPHLHGQHAIMGGKGRALAVSGVGIKQVTWRWCAEEPLGGHPIGAL